MYNVVLLLHQVAMDHLECIHDVIFSLRFDSRLVCNFDETFLAVKDTKLRVVVPRDARKATKVRVGEMSYHITLLVCVSADGAHTTPTAILPCQTLPREEAEWHMMFNWAGSETGWINERLWESWVLSVFIPWIVQRRKDLGLAEDAKALLWSDGHGTRANLKALEAMSKAHITLATIPSHTSHIMQPLDCGVFHTLKKSIRKFACQGVVKVENGLPEYRRGLMVCAKAALHDAMNPLVIEKAFATCGLVPWNPASVLGDNAKIRPHAPPPTPPKTETVTTVISGTICTVDMIKQIHDRRKEAEVMKKEVSEQKNRIKEEKTRLKEEKQRAKEEKQKERKEKKRVLESQSNEKGSRVRVKTATQQAVVETAQTSVDVVSAAAKSTVA